jgi:hypothetical protein
VVRAVNRFEMVRNDIAVKVSGNRRRTICYKTESTAEYIADIAMKSNQNSVKKGLRSKAAATSSLNTSIHRIDPQIHLPSPHINENTAENLQPNEKGGIEVAVRVRPLSAEELSHGIVSCCEVSLEDNSVVISKKERALSYLKSQMGISNEYGYDYAFDETVSQIEVYKRVGQPLIEKVLQGYNATIFAYGATGMTISYDIKPLTLSVHVI